MFCNRRKDARVGDGGPLVPFADPGRVPAELGNHGADVAKPPGGGLQSHPRTGCRPGQSRVPLTSPQEGRIMAWGLMGVGEVPVKAEGTEDILGGSSSCGHRSARGVPVGAQLGPVCPGLYLGSPASVPGKPGRGAPWFPGGSGWRAWRSWGSWAPDAHSAGSWAIGNCWSLFKEQKCTASPPHWVLGPTLSAG